MQQAAQAVPGSRRIFLAHFQYMAAEVVGQRTAITIRPTMNMAVLLAVLVALVVAVKVENLLAGTCRDRILNMTITLRLHLGLLGRAVVVVVRRITYQITRKEHLVAQALL